MKIVLGLLAVQAVGFSQKTPKLEIKVGCYEQMVVERTEWNSNFCDALKATIAIFAGTGKKTTEKGRIVTVSESWDLASYLVVSPTTKIVYAYIVLTDLKEGASFDKLFPLGDPKAMAQDVVFDVINLVLQTISEQKQAFRLPNPPGLAGFL